MKTQIQYPTGLSITIEYDANEANQLPEVDKFTAEAISYQHRDLLDEVAALKRLIDMYQKELIKLKEEIQKLSAEPVPYGATASPAIIFEKKEKHAEKSAPKWSKKPCSKCGELFQPTGPRSTLCENCKAEKQTEPAE